MLMELSCWGALQIALHRLGTPTFWMRSRRFLGTGAVRPYELKWPARALTAE